MEAFRINTCNKSGDTALLAVIKKAIPGIRNSGNIALVDELIDTYYGLGYLPTGIESRSLFVRDGSYSILVR